MTQIKNWVTVSKDGMIVAMSEEDTASSLYFDLHTPLHRYIHINDQIAWLSFLADVRNGIEPEPVVLRLTQRNEMRFSDVIFSYMHNSDDNFNIKLICKDNQQINPLFAVAHELRTPLNSIIGFSDLMLYSLNDKQKMRSYIDTIKHAGHHLLNVIEAILQKTEIENENIINCDVCHIVRDSLMMFVSIQGKKTITFNSPHKSVLAAIDETALRQIVFNLIANALKFTAEFGHVEIDVDIIDAKTVRFKVKDDGCGMNAQDMAQITQPFKRSLPARENKVQGNGLGLSLVHNLVQRFNGTLSFDSKVNQGTLVTITLPLADINAVCNSDVINFIEVQNNSLTKTVINNDKDKTKDENTRQTA